MTAREIDRSAAPGWADRAWARITGVRSQLMTSAQIVQALTDTERLMSRLASVQIELLAELARPTRWDEAACLVEAMRSRQGREDDNGGDPRIAMMEALAAEQAERMAAAEASAALRISSLAAARRVNDAVELAAELPATLEALREGLVERGTAAMLLERTSVLDQAARREVEDRILPLVASRSVHRVRVLTDRAVIAVDPSAAAKREKHAKSDRNVTHRPLPDGMGLISAHLPADGALSVQTLLQVIADADPDRTRPVGARRADALVGLADALLTKGRVDLRGLSGCAVCPAALTASDTPHEPHEILAPAAMSVPEASDGPHHRGGLRESAPGGPFRPPTRQGRPVDLVVTVSLSTLAGLDELPGNLAGHGVITADWARSLAVAARSVTMLALDPETGAALGIGARTYRPRRTLRDRVLTLQERCGWPGCVQQAWRCDLDHRRPFDHAQPGRGGRTDAENLDPLCRWHHLLKTHTSWSVQRGTDRAMVVTSPTGLRHIHAPVEFTLPGEWTDRRYPLPEHARSEHARPEHARAEHGKAEHVRAEHGRAETFAADPTGPADLRAQSALGLLVRNVVAGLPDGAADDQAPF